MRCKDGQATLKVSAVARRTLGSLAAAHEQFEFLVALLARVLEKRHALIIAGAKLRIFRR
jgi:hypothetical protein